MAAEELQRVSAFLEILRGCAARTALGVNFIPGTPNLHRVVEMSALTAALTAAFPELRDTPELALPRARADFLPWPQSGWQTQAPRAAGAAPHGMQHTLKRIRDIQAGNPGPTRQESGAAVAGAWWLTLHGTAPRRRCGRLLVLLALRCLCV